jgi:hypothetical protein
MSGPVDSLLGTLLWPLFTLFYYVRFIVLFVIISIPLLIKGLTGGDIFADYLNLYDFCNMFPFGKYVFSGFITFFTPNNGFFATSVDRMQLGVSQEGDSIVHCEISQGDRYYHRNPFGCIHLVVLTNVAELCSGISFVALMQKVNKQFKDKANADGQYVFLKAIPVKTNAEYFTKTKGSANAKSVVTFNEQEKSEFLKLIESGSTETKMSVDKEFKTNVYDNSNTCTCTYSFTWQVSATVRQSKGKAKSS